MGLQRGWFYLFRVYQLRTENVVSVGHLHVSVVINSAQECLVKQQTEIDIEDYKPVTKM
jgi:hypothetical protein